MRKEQPRTKNVLAMTSGRVYGITGARRAYALFVERNGAVSINVRIPSSFMLCRK
jgi:hypothetical protein